MAEKIARTSLEVADIIRKDGASFCSEHTVSYEQRNVMRHLVQCRTAELGGHVDQCDQCGHLRVSYNSCRDRHCPKCQNIKRAEWLHERFQRLLPIPYFHVVFTLPSELNGLFLSNKSIAVDMLFKAASATLKQVAKDSKHLGADIGFTAILHTWGQNLQFHPHLHCVVTGGGLSPDGTRWIPARKRFFLPVKVLGKLFRGKFLSALSCCYKKEKFVLVGDDRPLLEIKKWRYLIDTLYAKDWVVYAKPPFGGSEQVFRYLGRYTHRVAISNARLLAHQDGTVTFSVRDYSDAGRNKALTLNSTEFIRRFLLHTLPKQLVRIRHFGLMAGRNVNGKLLCARRLLEPSSSASCRVKHNIKSLPWREKLSLLMGFNVMACPQCETGMLRPCVDNGHVFEKSSPLWNTS